MVRTKLGGLPTDRFWAAPPAKQTSGYWRRGLIHVRPAAMPVPVYHPYTTKFDIEIDADHLDQVLGPLTTTNAKAVADAWDVVQTGLLAWRTKLHLTAADADARIRNQLSKDQLTGTVVTLLFDQSGSMRGQKMLFSAATADIIQEFVRSLGIYHFALEGRSFPQTVEMALSASQPWAFE